MPTEPGHAKRPLLQSLLNLLHARPDTAFLRRKVKRAGWDDAFLLSLIAHMQ